MTGDLCQSFFVLAWFVLDADSGSQNVNRRWGTTPAKVRSGVSH